MPRNQKPKPKKLNWINKCECSLACETGQTMLCPLGPSIGYKELRRIIAAIAIKAGRWAIPFPAHVLLILPLYCLSLAKGLQRHLPAGVRCTLHWLPFSRPSAQAVSLCCLQPGAPREWEAEQLTWSHTAVNSRARIRSLASVSHARTFCSMLSSHLCIITSTF